MWLRALIAVLAVLVIYMLAIVGGTFATHGLIATSASDLPDDVWIVNQISALMQAIGAPVAAIGLVGGRWISFRRSETLQGIVLGLPTFAALVLTAWSTIHYFQVQSPKLILALIANGLALVVLFRAFPPTPHTNVTLRQR